MKNVIYTMHCSIYTSFISYITNIEFHFRILECMTHIILFFFIPAKNPNFLKHFSIQKPFEYSITKRTCTTSN